MSALPPRVHAADFNEVARSMRPVVFNLARRYARGGAGEVDDLVQEGHVAMLAALPKYDPNRGVALKTYVSGVLSRTFSKVLRDKLRSKRTPRVWQERDGEWVLVPCSTVSLDELTAPTVDENAQTRQGLQPTDSTPDPEMASMTTEQERAALQLLFSHLSEFQRRVLTVYIAPPAGLLATARNMSGTYDVTFSHMAVFLGVTITRIEYAMRKIRQVVAALDMTVGAL